MRECRVTWKEAPERASRASLCPHFPAAAAGVPGDREMPRCRRKTIDGHAGRPDRCARIDRPVADGYVVDDGSPDAPVPGAVGDGLVGFDDMQIDAAPLDRAGRNGVIRR